MLLWVERGTRSLGASWISGDLGWGGGQGLADFGGEYARQRSSPSSTMRLRGLSLEIVGRQHAQ
eukprot:8282295-Alexandrium_andersonii.AAC.1